MSILKQLLIFLLMCTFNLTTILLYNNIFNRRFKIYITNIILPVLLTITYIKLISMYSHDSEYLLLAYIFIEIIILLSIFYNENIIVIMLTSVNCVFNIVILGKIGFRLVDIFYNLAYTNMPNIRESGYVILVVHYILLTINSLLYLKKYPKDTAKKLIKNYKIIFLSSTLKILLIIVSINVGEIARYVDINIRNDMYMLTIYMVIYLCFLMIMFIEKKFIKFEEVQNANNIMEIQLNYQEALFKKRNQYSETLRMYNHDFKNILKTVNTYLEYEDIENAKIVLKKVYFDINTTIDKNKSYSNKIVIDAILSGLAERCNKDDIDFSAQCYIPSIDNIKDLDLSRVFNNLADNAYEACINDSLTTLRKIEFKSFIKNNMLVIYQSNTFSGKIVEKDNRFLSTKDDKHNHGFGISIIEKIVSSVNGTTIITVDDEKKIFKCLIKIPIRE